MREPWFARVCFGTLSALSCNPVFAVAALPSAPERGLRGPQYTRQPLNGAGAA